MENPPVLDGWSYEIRVKWAKIIAHDGLPRDCYGIPYQES